jgi:hypothetical protein
MNYYEFETRNELNNTITGTNKNHTGLNSQIGILRPIYYNQVFDHPYMLEFLLPYGVEYNYKAERLRFWNLTAVTITELHLAPAGTDKWEPNQCENDPDKSVDSDERLTITGVEPGRYDIKLQDKRDASALCGTSRSNPGGPMRHGPLVFPLQLTVLLSEPARDFSGGEFVLVEQRPRAQSKAEVVPLAQGEAVIFAVHHRPVRGTRGWYRRCCATA